MDKNILAFVNRYYIPYNLKRLVLRIVALFAISYGVLALVELYSPYGFGSISFFSENALPYTITLTITALLFSIADICLYRIKLQWSFIVMRGLTNLYGSVLLLIASLMEFDGNNFYLEEFYYIVIKSVIYTIVIPLDLVVLVKIIIPHCADKRDRSHLRKGIILTSVLGFRGALRASENVHVRTILSFCACLLAVALLINTIYFFTQAYYAKKYSINTIYKVATIPPRSLHTLK